MILHSGIKNIVFDLGGVILNIDYQKTSEAFKALGFKNFDSFYSQKSQTDVFNLLETGAIDVHQFVSEIQQHISHASSHEIISAWNAMLLDLPEKRLELLETLSKRYRLFLLSNTNEIHEQCFIQNLQEEFGVNPLEELFEKVYYSHQIGLRKPNTECFEFVLSENNLSPQETLFIDDSAQHIAGAQKCGIYAYLLPKAGEITLLFPDTAL